MDHFNIIAAHLSYPLVVTGENLENLDQGQGQGHEKCTKPHNEP